jgi:hypothetical protein
MQREITSLINPKRITVFPSCYVITSAYLALLKHKIASTFIFH